MARCAFCTARWSAVEPCTQTMHNVQRVSQWVRTRNMAGENAVVDASRSPAHGQSMHNVQRVSQWVRTRNMDGGCG